uniref:ANAPC4_WD40 domain-containing protein n=1 Tax=Rhabditophanes sp. KR3021 TaxID=114890 RepID=A0AC35TZA5_9BILA
MADWKPEKLITDSKSFKAPFTIHIAKWNPMHDNIVLASREGELALRRNGWRKGWKIDVSKVKGVYYEKMGSINRANKEAGFVECLEWSPNGLYLAVGLSNNYVHIIDYETGQVRYSKRFSHPVVNLKWQWLVDKKDIQQYAEEFLETTNSSAHFPTFYADEEANRDRYAAVELIKEFCLYSVPRDLFGTMLFVVTEDLSIHGLACGLFPGASIKLPVEKFGNFDPSSGEVMDINYDKETKKLYVAYYGTAYGSPCFSKEHGVSEITPETPDRVGQDTIVCEFDLKFDHCAHLADLFVLACRWAQLYYAFIYTKCSFEYLICDWKDAMSLIVSVFRSYNLPPVPEVEGYVHPVEAGFHRELARQICAGFTSPTALYHLRFKLKMEGLARLHDTVVVKLTDVAKQVSGPLRMGIDRIVAINSRIMEERKSMASAFESPDAPFLRKPDTRSNWIYSLSKRIEFFQRGFDTERENLLNLVRYIFHSSPFASFAAKVNKKSASEGGLIDSPNYPPDLKMAFAYLLSTRQTSWDLMENFLDSSDEDDAAALARGLLDPTAKLDIKAKTKAFLNNVKDRTMKNIIDTNKTDDWEDLCPIKEFRTSVINKLLVGQDEEKVLTPRTYTPSDHIMCEVNNLTLFDLGDCSRNINNIPHGIMKLFECSENLFNDHLEINILNLSMTNKYNVELSHPVGCDKVDLKFVKNITRKEKVQPKSKVVAPDYIRVVSFRGESNKLVVNSIEPKLIGQQVKPVTFYGIAPSQKHLVQNTGTVLPNPMTGFEEYGCKEIISFAVNEANCVYGLAKLKHSPRPDLALPFFSVPESNTVYVDNTVEDLFECSEILHHRIHNIGVFIALDRTRVYWYSSVSKVDS